MLKIHEYTLHSDLYIHCFAKESSANIKESGYKDDYIAKGFGCGYSFLQVLQIWELW